MRKANYELVAQDSKHVLIKDIGPWDKYFTVTNAAEQVVAELAPMLAGRRLEYIDSEGHCAVLLVDKNGKFAGFDPR
jgi:hypothetical protein